MNGITVEASFSKNIRSILLSCLCPFPSAGIRPGSADFGRAPRGSIAADCKGDSRLRGNDMMGMFPAK